MAMKIGEWVKSEVDYGRNLAGSGWHGAREAAGTLLEGEGARAVWNRSLRSSWVPTAIGVGVGAVCALIAGGRRPKAGAVAAMSVAGGVAGFTAGVAWETRQLSSGIARGAMRGVGEARDSHWLSKNPINFG
ncbi:MAG: hypothetical protein P4M01_00725 [Acidobacteriota bacterium]|nr:hypothetical protein [Acidobacteriota bacterium]